MKTFMTVSVAALLAATGMAAAAETKVGIWQGNAFVDINDVQDERLRVLFLSMPAMEDFIRTNDPELIITGRDLNGNGVLDQDEFVVAGDISAWDTNGDGVLTGAEYQAGLMRSGVMTTDGNGVLTQDVVGSNDWLAFDVHGENSVSPASANAAPFIVRVGVATE